MGCFVAINRCGQFFWAGPDCPPGHNGGCRFLGHVAGNLPRSSKVGRGVTLWHYENRRRFLGEGRVKAISAEFAHIYIV